MKVQLLLEDATNRRMLEAFLEPLTETFTGDEIQTADGYIVEHSLLSGSEEALLDRKRDEEPVFCPVIVLTPERESIVTAALERERDGVTLVDDVLPMPVRKRVLARRLSNLLAQRRQTAELKETTDRLEQFARVVSHDLRNPLNVASGRIELAQELDDNRHLTEASAAIDRSQKLVEDLLTLARQGTAVGERVSLELEALAMEAWRNVATEEASLSVDTDLTVEADRGRLLQLFENTFRNAVQHGGPNVAVTVGELEDGFYIADDGPGIPEEDRQEIFQAGFTTHDDGTGYGLNIVADIIDAHGWTVSIAESESRGTRFEIRGLEAT